MSGYGSWVFHIMEKLTRKDARSKGIITYFTGEPCKYGHISYRYTKSGGCAACINGVREAARKVEFRITEGATKLTTIRVRCFEADRPTLEAIALGMALMRDPEVTAADVKSHLEPVKWEGNTALFTFHVPPEHHPAFLEMAESVKRQTDKAGAHATRLFVLGADVCKVQSAEPPDEIRSYGKPRR